MTSNAKNNGYLKENVAILGIQERVTSHLKQHDIEVHLHELTWRPEGSRFGACHCLELSLLFGTYERWRGGGMLGNVDKTEWQERSQALRRQWLEFIK